MTPEERNEKQRELAEKESHLANVKENYGILNRGISELGGDVSDLAWKSECPAPRFFVGTGQVQWRIISWELARGAQGNLTREEL